MSLVLLSLSSWAGTSIGALHWYGRVETPWWSERQVRETRLEYEITQNHIDQMTEWWKSTGWSPKEIEQELTWDWPLGETSTRFLSKEEVLEAAMKHFRKEFNPKRDVFILWQPRYVFDSKTEEILSMPESIRRIFDGLENDHARDAYLRSIK